MDTTTIDHRLIPLLLELPSRHVLVDYDDEADVLYLSFEKPQQATDSLIGTDGHLYHSRQDRLVGVTILHARTRGQQPQE